MVCGGGCVFRVRTNLRLKAAPKLIDALIASRNLKLGQAQPVNFHIASESCQSKN